MSDRMTTVAPAAPAARSEPRLGDGVRLAYETELHKLMAQLTTRILILVCAIGPLAFAVILKVQSGTPSDALFGVWVHSSGFADLARDPRVRGLLGFPDRRRRAGRRPLLLRGSSRNVEDDPHPLVHA